MMGPEALRLDIPQEHHLPSRVLQGDQPSHVLCRSLAESIGLFSSCSQGWYQREGDTACAFEVQGVFIPKLAIKIGNAGNRLNQIASYFTACMQQREDLPYQAASSVRRINRDILRATDPQGNTRIFPGMLPQTSARNERMVCARGIFHHSIV